MSKQPDRDRALEAALSQIEKQFGKGSMMKMSDEELKMVDAISTGSLSIDLALGIGGIPRGRITELYGPESSGKCLTADTYVWTDKGLETIAEIFERAGQKASCATRITDIEDKNIFAFNEYGQKEKIQALTHNGCRPVYTLTCDSGRRLRMTANHPVRVMDANGVIVWRRCAKIQSGDRVLTGGFGVSEHVEGEIDPLSAELTGKMVADGALGNHNRVAYTKTYADERARYFELIECFAGQETVASAKIYQDKDIHINSPALRKRFYSELGLDYVSSKHKTVPEGIRKSGRLSQQAFLLGLFDGDCHFSKSGFEWVTASNQLAGEVQIMLTGLGIGSTIQEKIVEETPYWRLFISGADALHLADTLNFQSQRRLTQIQALREASGDKRARCERSVPHLYSLLESLQNHIGSDGEITDILFDVKRGLCDTSIERLKKVVSWARQQYLSSTAQALINYFDFLIDSNYIFETVTSNQITSEEPTFDICVPGSHSFLANGIVSHNTTLVYHLIAECQKAGGRAVFIDAEHALDPGYAGNIGVNVDDLYVAQPMSGEEALELADIMARSGAVDLIAVDSVAALTPKAELDGVMGQSTIGLQARMMSQAMRKIAGNLNKTDTALIFTNQIREKVGVMFGCFSYDSPVLLSDGSTLPIGKIVQEKLEIEVFSLDPVSGELQPRKITNWFDNGVTDQWHELVVQGYNKESHLQVTPNHVILTPEGERQVWELEEGDQILVALPSAVMASPQGENLEGSELSAVSMPVLSNRPFQAQVSRYDLQVEGNHTYLVDHVVVHNSPETQPGGRALKFYASVRMDIRRKAQIKSKNEFGNEEAVGNETKVKIVKNKTAPPFREADFEIRYGTGISREGEIIIQGVIYDIVTKSGSFYSYGETRLGQGQNNSVQFLQENPELRDKIENELRGKMGIIDHPVAATDDGLPDESEVAEFEAEISAEKA
jgi:recombination protein RecA